MFRLKSLLASVVALFLCAKASAISLQIDFTQNNWEFGLTLFLEDVPPEATARSYFIDGLFIGGGPGTRGFGIGGLLPEDPSEERGIFAPGTHTTSALVAIGGGVVPLDGPSYIITTPIGPRPIIDPPDPDPDPVVVPDTGSTLLMLALALIGLLSAAKLPRSNRPAEASLSSPRSSLG